MNNWVIALKIKNVENEEKQTFPFRAARSSPKCFHQTN
jgi:hypothetical protein